MGCFNLIIINTPTIDFRNPIYTVIEQDLKEYFYETKPTISTIYFDCFTTTIPIQISIAKYAETLFVI